MAGEEVLTMSDARSDAFDVTVRRRNRLCSVASVLLVSVLPAVLVYLSSVQGILLGLAPLSMLLGIALWNANLAPRERLGRFVVSELGLFFEQRRLCALSDVRDGALLLAPDDAPVVRIRTRRGSLELRVANAAEGRRLLRAAGADFTLGAAKIHLSSRISSDPGGFALIGMLALLVAALFPAIGYAWGQHFAAFVILASAAVAAITVVMTTLMASTTVSLGADGLRIRWLFRTRTIRYVDIEAVRAFDETPGGLRGARQRGLSLQLRSGEALRLPDTADEPADLGSIVDRIRGAIARSGRGDAVADEALLGSRGRTPSEWLRAVRALGAGANVDHRTAPLRTETLWRIVEDAAAEPEARAGAALALRAGLDETGRSRLRVAAMTAAAPGLRFALESAAGEGDDAEIEGALGALRREAANPGDR
jgi:hypothetical protein